MKKCRRPRLIWGARFIRVDMTTGRKRPVILLLPPVPDGAGRVHPAGEVSLLLLVAAPFKPLGIKGISGILCSMNNAPFYQLVIYTLVSVALIGGLLLAAWWLGAKRSSLPKLSPYESGVMPSGNARLSWPVPFYLIAIFFIIFDVEAAFIFAWAVAWDVLGLPGLIQITVFILILAAGLVWLWLKGGLDWGPSAARKGGGHA